MSENPPNDCVLPLVFYSCENNGFRGCCSIDPCSLEDCPNAGKIAPTAVSSSSSIDQNPSINSDGPAASTSPADSPNAVATVQPTVIATTNPQPQDGSTATSTVENASVSETPVLVIVTSEVYLVLETVTSTSSGMTMHPTSESWITSVAVSTMLVSSQVQTTTSPVLLSTKTGESSPSRPMHHTNGRQNIAGIVGGIVGALIAGLLILIPLYWHRKRRAREVRAAQHDDDPRLQGIDANRAGELLEEEASESPVGLKGSLEVNRSNTTLPAAAKSEKARNITAAKREKFSPKRTSFSPVSPLWPSRTAATPPLTRATTLSAMAAARQERISTASELEGSGLGHELSGQSSPTPLAELPAQQEQNSITTHAPNSNEEGEEQNERLSSAGLKVSNSHQDRDQSLLPTMQMTGKSTANSSDQNAPGSTSLQAECLKRECVCDHAASWSSFDGQAGPAR